MKFNKYEYTNFSYQIKTKISKLPKLVIYNYYNYILQNYFQFININ